MIWADRAGIGILALVALGYALGGTLSYLDGREQAIEMAHHQDANYQASVAGCEKRMKAPKDDLVREWLCPEGAPGPKPMPVKIPAIDDAAIAALRSFAATSAFLVFPFWVVLRIIDFVFGGPERRAGIRQ